MWSISSTIAPFGDLQASSWMLRWKTKIFATNRSLKWQKETSLAPLLLWWSVDVNAATDFPCLFDRPHLRIHVAKRKIWSSVTAFHRWHLVAAHRNRPSRRQLRPPLERAYIFVQAQLGNASFKSGQWLFIYLSTGFQLTIELKAHILWTIPTSLLCLRSGPQYKIVLPSLIKRPLAVHRTLLDPRMFSS